MSARSSRVTTSDQAGLDPAYRTGHRLKRHITAYRDSITRLAPESVSYAGAIEACLLREQIDQSLKQQRIGPDTPSMLADLQREDTRLVDALASFFSTHAPDPFLAARRTANPPPGSWWWYCVEDPGSAPVSEAGAFDFKALYPLVTICALFGALVVALIVTLRLSRTPASLTDLSTYLQVIIPLFAAASLTNVGRQLAVAGLQLAGVKAQYQARAKMVLAVSFLLAIVLLFFSLPSQAVWHNNQGRRAFDRKDLLSALDSFQRAASLNPAYSTAFYNLGNTYDALNRPDDAIGAYRQALELAAPPMQSSDAGPVAQPSVTWFAATNNMAQLMTLYGDPPDAATAVAALTRAMGAATPETNAQIRAALFRNRAFAQLTLGLYRNAAEDLAAATAILPDAPATACVAGLFYEEPDNPFQSTTTALDAWVRCLGATPADQIPPLWSAIAQERYRSIP